MTAHLKHIIITILIGLVLLTISYEVFSHLDKVHNDEFTLAKQKLVSDAQVSKVQSTQTNQDTRTLQIQVQTLAASTTNLRATVDTLRSQLNDRRKADEQLPASDLSSRWIQLTKSPITDIQPSGNGFQVSMTGARVTVDALEEIPVLQAENKTIADNSAQKDTVILGQTKLINDKDVELTTCKKTLVDQKDECSKQVKVERDKARKKGIVGFTIGFITGFIAGRKF